MDSKERFTNRVENYVKYRPSYPKEAVDFLYHEVGFEEQGTIADVGSGTGIFTRLLLMRGSAVYAVEPNRAMREAAEKALGGFERFYSREGSAEQTGLPDRSVDHIVSAQAFHWFDIPLAKREFGRIVRPGGKVALIWNSRLTDGDGFSEGYEQLLNRYANDYGRVNHKNISPAEFDSFFRGGYRKAEFPNRQEFDFEQLKGRLLSSSYVPLPGEKNYTPMMEALLDLYDRFQVNGRVAFRYVTEIYYGEV